MALVNNTPLSRLTSNNFKTKKNPFDFSRTTKFDPTAFGNQGGFNFGSTPNINIKSPLADLELNSNVNIGGDFNKEVKPDISTEKEVINIDERNFFDKAFDAVKNSDIGGDVLGGALDIIPLIGAGVASKRSKEFFNESKLTSEDADFRLGTVTDLARPNFATPTRAPQGSSLAEITASQKFGDIAQRGQEGAFEVENSVFRQGQRDAIIGRANRATEFNTGRKDIVKRFNATVAAQRGAVSKNIEHEFLAGALANVNTSRSENAQIDASNIAISAGEILRRGDASTYEEALDKAIAAEKKARKDKNK